LDRLLFIFIKKDNVYEKAQYLFFFIFFTIEIDALLTSIRTREK